MRNLKLRVFKYEFGGDTLHKEQRLRQMQLACLLCSCPVLMTMAQDSFSVHSRGSGVTMDLGYMHAPPSSQVLTL